MEGKGPEDGTKEACRKEGSRKGHGKCPIVSSKYLK
jgi:hypothetical protein